MIKALCCLIVAGALGAGTAAASDDRWIHVRVDETGGSKAKVDIQVPIGMVSGLLPMLSGKNAHGNIKLNEGEVELGELREYWNAVKAAKDGDYVTVRDQDSDVRISKSGGFVRLTVDEKRGGSRVRMKLPVSVIDAVFAGKNDIDLEAAAAALAKLPSGELLTVDDEDSHVRIWIDGEAAASRGDGS